jgi:hypothetical protein
MVKSTVFYFGGEGGVLAGEMGSYMALCSFTHLEVFGVQIFFWPSHAHIHIFLGGDANGFCFSSLPLFLFVFNQTKPR